MMHICILPITITSTPPVIVPSHEFLLLEENLVHQQRFHQHPHPLSVIRMTSQRTMLDDYVRTLYDMIQHLFRAGLCCLRLYVIPMLHLLRITSSLFRIATRIGSLFTFAFYRPEILADWSKVQSMIKLPFNCFHKLWLIVKTFWLLARVIAHNENTFTHNRCQSCERICPTRQNRQNSSISSIEGSTLSTPSSIQASDVYGTALANSGRLNTLLEALKAVKQEKMSIEEWCPGTPLLIDQSEEDQRCKATSKTTSHRTKPLVIDDQSPCRSLLNSKMQQSPREKQSSQEIPADSIDQSDHNSAETIKTIAPDSNERLSTSTSRCSAYEKRHRDQMRAGSRDSIDSNKNRLELHTNRRNKSPSQLENQQTKRIKLQRIAR